MIQPNSPPQLHAGHSCGDDHLGHNELGLDKSETARMRVRLSLLLTLETSWEAHTRHRVRSKPGSLHMHAHMCTHTTSLKRLEAAASWASLSYDNNWLHLSQTAPWRQGVLCHLPKIATQNWGTVSKQQHFFHMHWCLRDNHCCELSY